MDSGSWAVARHLHRNGFISLVAPRRPLLPTWLDKYLNAASGGAAVSANEYGYRVNIADMHRMYMRYLQSKLVKAAITLHSKESNISGTTADALESTLRKYVQAVQDQEYMTKHSRQRNDPFIASSERLHDSYILEREMTRQGKIPSDFEELKANAIPTGPWEKGSKSGAQPLCATRAETIKRGLFSRLAGALVGGAFLIGPMWLLALERDLYFQLGFTTGFVSVFGLLMAWFLNTPEAVFAASIAYAAVLMVFIGVIMQEAGGG